MQFTPVEVLLCLHDDLSGLRSSLSLYRCVAVEFHILYCCRLQSQERRGSVVSGGRLVGQSTTVVPAEMSQQLSDEFAQNLV